jgi:hypothetical protein
MASAGRWHNEKTFDDDGETQVLYRLMLDRERPPGTVAQN